MKLGIIGGGSVRTPLLIKNLLEKDDPELTEIAIFDTDHEKVKLIRPVLDEIACRLGSRKRITLCKGYTEMAEGADFVFSSFRQGGDGGRVFDETLAESLGMLGQETVGAGGASMALRTLPYAMGYAEELQKISPDAWLINFTNPSGILTEALLNYSSHKKIIGICDAPIVIKNMASRYLRCPVHEIDFRSFGLNHLGWVYDITWKGKPVLKQLVEEAEEFVKTEPLYTNMVDHIKETGLIPNEYLLFYLHSEDIRKKYAEKSYKRSQFIADINAELFKNLRNRRDVPAIEVYENYLTKRESSYMAVESGNPRKEEKIDIFALKDKFGYDDVAIAVMDSLRGKGDITLPVNRKNDSCSYLDRNDIVEVDTQICKDGYKQGFNVPELPDFCRNLILSVKSYERNLVKGYFEKDTDLIVKALGQNPLIAEEKAEALLNAVLKNHNIKGFR